MTVRFTFLLSLSLSLSSWLLRQTIPTPTQTGTTIVNLNGKAHLGDHLLAYHPGSRESTHYLSNASGTRLPMLAPIIIDQFTTNQATITAPPSGSSTSSTGGTDIIGARRGMVGNLLSGAGPSTIGVSGGNLNFNVTNTTPDSRGEAVITWDGDTSPTTLTPTGLGGVNLASGGNNAFRLSINSATAGTEITLDVYTNGSNASRGVFVLPAVAAPTDFFLNFISDFVSTLGTGADFSSVGAIVMTVRGTEKSCSINQVLVDITSPSIPTPTQTGTIVTDPNGNNKADPSDKIRYKVTVQNTGSSNATGVKLQANPDARTTLDGASFRTSPVAVNDGPYACTGNVGISIPAASGVKSNDYDDALVSATLSVVTAPANGSVTLNNDGSFTYTPNAGFTGNDQFTYEITDATAVAGHTPASTDIRGTVSITVSDMIWFVDNSVVGPGTGTVSDPFKTLASTATASSTGHVIFVKHTGINYTGGITLKNNQYLFGTGHTGGSNLADMSVLPFSLAANSLALPTINGSRPIIENAGGNGVTLASGNTLRGFNVGNTPAANAGISGNGIGTLAVNEVSVNGTGQILSLNDGTVNASFGELSTTSTTQTAIVLSNLSGSITDNNASNSSISGATGVFSITGTTSTTVSLTFNGDVTHTGGNPLVIVQNHNTGTLTFQNGTLSSTGGGINFTNADGTNHFNGTNTLSGSSRITIDGGSSGTFNFSSSTSVTNPANVALDINGSSATVDYNGTLSSNTAFRLVDIANNTGGTVNIDGTLSGTGSSQGIRLQQNSGGTYNFTNASKVLTTGANTAITLSSNTGATINFTGGGLVINSTSGTGFSATGGGTVTVQGTGNTISSTSGTALNVANTTIGASGMTFRSISSGNNGAAADPANGIVLNTTGSSGGLTVSGTGSAGTGGTIQFCTGDNISLNSCISVSLSHMNVKNGGQNNIDATSVTGLTLTNLDVDFSNSHGFLGSTVRNLVISGGSFKNGGQGAPANGLDGINITNLLGTCSITGTTIQSSCTRQMYVVNNTATAAYPATPQDVLTLSGTTWNNHNVGAFFGDHCIFTGETNSNFRLITNSTSGVNSFSTGGVAINLFAQGDGHVQGSIKGLTVSTSTAGFVASITGSGAATNDFRVEGNTFTNTGSLALSCVNTSTGTGVMQGIVHDNDVTMNAGSGYDAMQAILEGNGTTHFQFSNNTVSGNFQRGIGVVSRVGTGTMNATVNNNDVNNSDPAGLQAFRLEVGASGGGTTNTLRLNMYGNTGTSVASTGYRMLHRTGYTFQLQDFVGNGSSTTDVQAWINNAPKSNVGTGTITVGPGFTASAGAIPTPNLPAGL